MIIPKIWSRPGNAPLLSRRERLRASYRPTLESLEARALMTLGVPTWLSEGPAPVATFGSTPTVRGGGAARTVAINPGNANVAFAATDGGVWKTANFSAANPHWVPVTDAVTNLARPSLGTTDVAFSPLDATNKTVYAATGRLGNSYRQPARRWACPRRPTAARLGRTSATRP